MDRFELMEKLDFALDDMAGAEEMGDHIQVVVTGSVGGKIFGASIKTVSAEADQDGGLVVYLDLEDEATMAVISSEG